MTTIRVRYKKFRRHKWTQEESAYVRTAVSESRPAADIAIDLGLVRWQVLRHAERLGVTNNGLRPGILRTLASLEHPLRPVTRAMLTKTAPGNRCAISRVVSDMLKTGELAGNPADIRPPNKNTGDDPHDRDAAVQNRSAGAPECVR